MVCVGVVVVWPPALRVSVGGRGGGARRRAGVQGAAAMPAVLPPQPPRKIAAAVDFSPADTGVLSFAVSLARSGGSGASVLLLHVVESAGARAMGDDMGDVEATQDAERLDMYRKELGELVVEATYDLGFGQPADALAGLVDKAGVDLLVLGSHGHGGVADLIHGTTVERLRHKVRVPVLVVPVG